MNTEQKTEDKKKRKFTQLLLQIKRTKRQIKKANCVTKEKFQKKTRKYKEKKKKGKRTLE